MRTTSSLRLVATLAATALAGALLAPAASATGSSDDRGPTRPRGLRVALVWNHVDPASDSSGLVVGDPFGVSALPLTTPPPGVRDTEPVRSPDGRSVVFNRESESGVALTVVTVGVPASLRTIDTGCAATPDCFLDVNPSWTADGRRITFTRVAGPFDEETGDAASAALHSARLDGSDVRRLSAPDLAAGAEDTAARYTPDGRYVVFVRDQRIDGVLSFAVFRMRPDGTGVQQLTPWDLDADRPAPSPALRGPTAGLVAFETAGGAEPGRGDVALLPVDCTSVERCTAATRYVTHNDGGPRSSFAASWSPDGRSLAFAEEPDGSGAVAVWTSRWDGEHRRRVTGSVHDFSPAWSY